MRASVAIVFLWILSILLCSVAMAGEVWRITSLEWPPYSDSHSSTQGQSIQKLRSLLEKEDIELVVEFYPWARAQDVAQQGGYLGYYPAWPEEVGVGFKASSPVDWSEIAVMTYKGSGIEWNGFEALFQVKVGLVKNYQYPEFITLQAKRWQKNVDPTPNEVALLKMLSSGRIKVAITSPLVMFHLAEKLHINNIRILKTLSSNPLVVAVEDSPENMKKFEVLERIINNPCDK